MHRCMFLTTANGKQKSIVDRNNSLIYSTLTWQIVKSEKLKIEYFGFHICSLYLIKKRFSLRKQTSVYPNKAFLKEK